MVNLFGVLRSDADNMLPSVLDIYFSANDSETEKNDRKNLAEQVMAQFSQSSGSPEEKGKAVWVDYVGVWDTVESVGWPMFRRRISSVTSFWDKHFVAVRHAVALHEHRRMFKQRLYTGLNKASCSHALPLQPTDPRQRSIQQRWFPGVHCDVGGGEKERRHANATLRWVANGLFLNGPWPDGLRTAVRTMCQKPGKPPYRQFHDELHVSPGWALLGMVVRDDMPRPIPRSRQINGQATVWNQLQLERMLLALFWLAITMGFYALAMGLDFANIFDLAWVQLAAVCAPADLLAAMREEGNRTATWLDFTNIASVTWLMVNINTRAFQRLSLRHQTRPGLRRVLQGVGWLPPVYLLADSTENLLSLAYGATEWTGAGCFVWLPMLALSIASFVKFASLILAVLPIVVWVCDVFCRLRKPHISRG